MSTTITKAELEAQNKELEAKLAEMQAQLAALTAVKTAPIAPVIPVASSEVVLVYTSDSPGIIKYSTGELMCTTFGEEFTVSRTAFDEIVGKYRHWFNEGILAVSSKNIDVAAAKKLPTDKEYGLTAEKLSNLGKMTTAQIEQLWNSVENQSMKDSIVYYFKRKFIENAPGYQDNMRVQTLNGLSGGRLAAESEQLSGRNFVAPTDFMTGPKDRIKVI